MDSATHRYPWYTYLGFGLVVAALIGFLYLVRDILPPFVVALVVAWLFDPLLTRLEKRNVPRGVAVLCIFIVLIGAVVVGLMYLLPAVRGQANEFEKDLPTYKQSLRTDYDNFADGHKAVFNNLGVPLTFDKAVASYGDNMKKGAKPAFSVITNFVVSNVSKLLWIILTPLITIYLMLDLDRVRRRVPLLLPELWRDDIIRMISRMAVIFSNYLRGLLLVCAMYGIIAMVVLSIFHLKYAIVVGLLAGIFYAIPYIGPLFNALMVFLVGLATFRSGVLHPLVVMGVMVAVGQAFDMLITPRVLGKSVGLHPVFSIFALMVGGKLFGVPGMILAVPVAACIQEIILEFYPGLRSQPAPEVLQPEKEESQTEPRRRKRKTE
jgi:predicted PurR-regulated permease PerM